MIAGSGSDTRNGNVSRIESTLSWQDTSHGGCSGIENKSTYGTGFEIDEWDDF